MAPKNQNPADLVKYYVDLINHERERLQESLQNITDYAEQLKRVTSETQQRLLTRD